jgi:hypothetical protein
MKTIQQTIAIGLAILYFASSSSAKSLQSVEFDFSINEKMPKDSRVIKVGPHPCGAYVVARVRKMPSLDSNGYLIPDKVVEVDDRNKTLRRWAKPLDAEVLSVSGDRISIGSGDKLYWIDTSGNFSLQRTKVVTPSPTFLRKAKKHPEFKVSDYAGIWAYKDLRTGKVRRIIYEGACT